MRDRTDLTGHTFVARRYLRGFAPIDALGWIIGSGQLTGKLQRVIALLSVRIAMRFEKDLSVLELRQQHGLINDLAGLADFHLPEQRAASSGCIRMQPGSESHRSRAEHSCRESRTTESSVRSNNPNGLLGPGGTVFLTTLPARAHSSWIDFGTYQVGFSRI